MALSPPTLSFFFFNDTATTEIYPLSLHDALPISELREDTFYAVIWVERDGHVISIDSRPSDALALALRVDCPIFVEDGAIDAQSQGDRKSTRLNSSHQIISYAVFCLKKKRLIVIN